ncbi:AAA family ATPase [Archangium primigenium]|uniref:AAA family ATPase n=1 Tax=[Archangium] primigenium TaxID=2792470 RepID=UPI00195BA3F1|nr:AAA family ATPase [Archangium primigenium]MBM7115713.1 AAA family ATPase [Archangium primigenium]
MAEQDNTGRVVSPPTPTEEALSADTLAEKVHARYSARKRQEIPIELVREVVSKLNLTKPRRRRAARLRLGRLLFTGEKRLEEIGSAPIHYDQRFQPGVNVLLVPDNDVGKSSILKTIKYALTGDDSDYDGDVRSWLHRIWLQFYIDGSPFTVHISKEASSVGYIASGHTDRPADESDDMPELLESMIGAEAITNTLHQFFFKRLGITGLSWTQATSTGAERRTTTWRTFFQALVIPDSSDQYLLLDEKHSMGNQDGLILSVLLGLSLVEPLNELLIEKQKTRKEQKVSDEERAQAEAAVADLRQQLQSAQDELLRLDTDQRARLSTYETGTSGQQLLDLRSQKEVKAAEVSELERRQVELNTNIKRRRARARAIREAVDFRLHFTGLEVSLCPNCDTDVDAQAVERERKQHICRLCGKPPHESSPSEVEAQLAEADELESQAKSDVQMREHLNEAIVSGRAELDRLDRQETGMREVLKRGLDYVLPTPEEQRQRSGLEQQIGAINVRITFQTGIIKRHSAGGDGAGLRAQVQDRVRDVLREEAEQMNQTVLTHLANLTQEMARRIGTESITDLTCSALGKVGLRKNGVEVSFNNTRNPGERLRVKLAFFLAMMRLGRVEHAGRHPGFLMIDQPGSAEMVEEDFVEFARVLRETDRDYADELQIICFTARPPFAEATAPQKLYGPAAGKYAF